MQDLIVVKTQGGKCIGFFGENDTYEEVFCVGQGFLFEALADFLDGKRIAIRILTGDKGKSFLCENDKKKLLIWRTNEYSSFLFGKRHKRIGTFVDRDTPYVYEVTLHKGFKAVVVNSLGKGRGVYERSSGAFVGFTIEEVNRDIDNCDDIEFMKAQIKQCREQNDPNGIKIVSYEEFGIE